MTVAETVTAVIMKLNVRNLIHKQNSALRKGKGNVGLYSDSPRQHSGMDHTALYLQTRPCIIATHLDSTQAWITQLFTCKQDHAL